MLALTRKKSESIIIGDNIEVIVLNLQGDQVKLGIIAPKEISVHRKEVYLQIQEENKKAAQNSTDALAGLKSLITKPKE
ncbi:MAG: carbon storage regulator CsrA [Clostridiales bacterium]|jgi:carbon storage regulator|nr:carbon storage regulator CsrA [Clostridiales bacterium]